MRVATCVGGLILLVCTLAVAGISLNEIALAQQSIHVDQEVVELSDGAKCTLCGIVINEVEGFTAENRSEEEIMFIITNDVCKYIGSEAREVCLQLVKDIPFIIQELDSREKVSVICVNRGYCKAPFIQRHDPISVPTYTIDLELPPSDRWKQICSNATYQLAMGEVLAGLRDLFGNGSFLSNLGKTINIGYFPSEYADEIRGCAAEMHVDFGWLTLFNMGYEVTDGCTSIVAQTNDNKILHVRNMDFWDGIWLTDHLKNLTIQVDYQIKGKTVFHATTFAGFVGVLSGMRPNGFSISIDTRNYPQGIGQLFYEVIAAITEKNASLVSFLARNTLSRVTDFEGAVSSLSNGLLIADVYYIVGGVSANQGAVVTRNRENASDVWRLQSPSRWFEVQTNYDHWNKPPWYDDRVDPANHAMLGLGRGNLTLQNLLDDVLMVKPVFNLQTTFSMLACAADDTYISYARDCPYPCAE